MIFLPSSSDSSLQELGLRGWKRREDTVLPCGQIILPGECPEGATRTIFAEASHGPWAASHCCCHSWPLWKRCFALMVHVGLGECVQFTLWPFVIKDCFKRDPYYLEFYQESRHPDPLEEALPLLLLSFSTMRYCMGPWGPQVFPCSPRSRENRNADSLVPSLH